MINSEVFLQVFQSVFDETSPDQIQFSTNFRDLEEWSSLIVLSLLVSIEENLGKTITARDIEKSITVEDLYTLVNSK